MPDWNQYKVTTSTQTPDKWSDYKSKSIQIGNSPDNPLEEQGVTRDERDILKFWAPHGTRAQIEWLKRKPGEEGKPKDVYWGGILKSSDLNQYDAVEYKPGKIAVRKIGDTGSWKVVDPDTGVFSGDLPQDLLDLAGWIPAMLMPSKGILQGAAHMAGLEGLDQIVGKKVYGFKPTPEETQADIGTAAVGGGVAPIVGKAITGAPKVAGKILKAPYKAESKTGPQIQSILDEVSGRTKELEDIASRKAIDKEFAENIRREDLMKLLGEKESEKEFQGALKDLEGIHKGMAKESALAQKQATAASKAEMKAQSKAEAANFAQEGMKATEFRKEAARLLAQARDLSAKASGLPKEEAKVYRNMVDNLREQARVQAEKAREIQSRVGLYRMGIKQREADEAAKQVSGIKPSPKAVGTPPPTPIQGTPPAKTTIEPQIGYKGEEFKIESEAAKKMYETSRDAAFNRHMANAAAAKRLIGWPEANKLSDEVEALAYKIRQETREDAYRRIVAALEQKGMPRAQAIEKAASLEKINAVTEAMEQPAISATRTAMPSATDLFSKVVSKPPIEETMQQAAEEGARQALGQVRMMPRIGPSTVWRLTGGTLTRGAAIAGYLIDKSPSYIEGLAMKATSPGIRRELLKLAKLAGMDTPKEVFERAVRSAITIPGVREFIGTELDISPNRQKR